MTSSISVIGAIHNMISSDDIICPYKQKCTSYPTYCCTCSNNSGKRNYYRRANDDMWTPYTITWKAMGE